MRVVKYKGKKNYVNVTIDGIITKISKPSFIQKKKVNEFVILVTSNINGSASCKLMN